LGKILKYIIFKYKERTVMELLKENKLVKNILLLKIIYTLIGIISYLFSQ